MPDGKQGYIEYVIGEDISVKKSKTGSLLVVSSQICNVFLFSRFLYKVEIWNYSSNNKYHLRCGSRRKINEHFALMKLIYMH